MIRMRSRKEMAVEKFLFRGRPAKDTGRLLPAVNHQVFPVQIHQVIAVDAQDLLGLQVALNCKAAFPSGPDQRPAMILRLAFQRQEIALAKRRIADRKRQGNTYAGSLFFSDSR